MADKIDIRNLEEATAAMREQAEAATALKIKLGEINSEYEKELAIQNDLVTALGERVKQNAEDQTTGEKRLKLLREQKKAIEESDEANTLANKAALAEIEKQSQAIKDNIN